MESTIVRSHPLSTAMAAVWAAIGDAPEAGISYYYHELWRARTDQASADEFHTYTTAVTSVIAELASDDVVSTEAIIQAGLSGAILGMMVTRTAYPTHPVHTTISAVYDHLSDKIVKNGAHSLHDKAEGMRNYASLHEITLPSDVRAQLLELNRRTSGTHAVTGYIMSLLSMYTAAQMMYIEPDVQTLLHDMPETEFDELLRLIETGPCKFSEHPPTSMSLSTL